MSPTTASEVAVVEPADETEIRDRSGYADWDQFWSAFSSAAASGDVATIDGLTADQMAFVYAGGSVSSWTGPKEDFLGSFNRPQEIFEPGRQALSDGTAFSVEFRGPGQGSSFDGFGVRYEIAYSVSIEESEGGPASASEYIFDKVDGQFLFVGYSVDS